METTATTREAEQKTKRTYSYVNVYRLDRHYGGGEEGGWWYTSYEPVYSERCFTEAFAWFRVNKVAEKYPRNGNSSSVNYHSKPDDFTIFVENEPGKYSPVETPHYE
jgi:hypothetical protein